MFERMIEGVQLIYMPTHPQRFIRLPLLLTPDFLELRGILERMIEWVQHIYMPIVSFPNDFSVIYSPPRREVNIFMKWGELAITMHVSVDASHNVSWTHEKCLCFYDTLRLSSELC